MAAFVEPTLSSARLDALWDVVLGARGVDEALALLDADVQPTGAFAVAATQGDQLRVVVRGPVSVTVQDLDGERVLGAGDAVMQAPGAVWFAYDGARDDGSALPMICGVVSADVLGWQPGATPVELSVPPELAFTAGGDHDGRTRVMVDPLPVAAPEVARSTEVGPEVEGSDVPATVVVAAPSAAPAPVPSRQGLLHFSTGQVIDVAGPVVIGRAPAQIAEGEAALLVPVRGAGRGISRNHVTVGVDDVGAYVMDLGSRNGTVVSFPGSSTMTLEPDVAYRLVDGAIVTIADVSFEFRALLYEV
jgi:hypothetical protein